MVWLGLGGGAAGALHVAEGPEGSWPLPQGWRPEGCCRGCSGLPECGRGARGRAEVRLLTDTLGQGRSHLGGLPGSQMAYTPG